LPVYVFIHGGAMVEGAGSWFNGSSLAATGMVVVTLNYRLGALGFLALDEIAEEDPRAPTNGGINGLLDQQEALRWVRRHIGAFAGDPERVTVGGESAGAFSVCYHLHLPGSDGLFRGAVLESGACSSWFFTLSSPAEGKRSARRLAELLGGKGAGLAALRKAPAKELLAQSLALEDSVGLFKGVVDEYHLRDDISRLPIACPGVAVLVGWNTMDVDAMSPLQVLPGAQTGLTTAEYYREWVSEHLSPEVLSLHPAPEPGASKELVRNAWIELGTEIEWGVPTMNLLAKLRAAGGRAFGYRFGYWPDNSSAGGLLWGKACHACEENFIWGQGPHTDDSFADPRWVPLVGPPIYNERIVGLMQALWGSFIRSGAPSATAGRWPPYAGDAGPLLEISSERSGRPALSVMRADPQVARFWNAFARASTENYLKLCNFTIPGSEGVRGHRAGLAAGLRTMTDVFV